MHFKVNKFYWYRTLQIWNTNFHSFPREWRIMDNGSLPLAMLTHNYLCDMKCYIMIFYGHNVLKLSDGWYRDDPHTSYPFKFYHKILFCPLKNRHCIWEGCSNVQISLNISRCPLYVVHRHIPFTCFTSCMLR